MAWSLWLSVYTETETWGKAGEGPLQNLSGTAIANVPQYFTVIIYFHIFQGKYVIGYISGKVRSNDVMTKKGHQDILAGEIKIFV